MQQKLVAVERVMTKGEAEAVDARISGYSDHLFRFGDNLSDSLPSVRLIFNDCHIAASSPRPAYITLSLPCGEQTRQNRSHE